MQDLTIGEVAKLFSISNDTIRNYIRKNLLTPRKQNHYYFSEVDIYRLYQIIVFTAIGCSLGQIKENFQTNQTEQLLEKISLNHTNKQDEFSTVNRVIEKITTAQKKYKLDRITFSRQEEKSLKKIAEFEDEPIIDFSTDAPFNSNQLEVPYHIIFNRTDIVSCVLSDKKTNDYFFPAGMYACKCFSAMTNEQIKTEVALFLEEYELNELDHSITEVLVYENIFCSLAYNQAKMYVIEAKISEQS